MRLISGGRLRSAVAVAALVITVAGLLTAARPEEVRLASADPAPAYWLAGADGRVYPFGSAGPYGSLDQVGLNKPIVGMAATPDEGGYWLVAADGGVFNFGDAGFFGSLGNVRLNKPIVGMAAAPDGGGYWLVAADGGVFNFGGAGFFGSLGNVRLNKPIVGMAAAPDGGGYWLVAADGGVFNFGGAGFFGSLGNVRLNKPIVGMAATSGGGGYWLVAADGGVFNFGDAQFRGSLGGLPIGAPIVAMARTVSTSPYARGSTGYDVSWPQCPDNFPAPPFELAIVGVGGKLTFTHNPCLAGEYRWFVGATRSLYVKLSSPAKGADPTEGNTGPAGICAPADTLCQAYNYGWNLVIDAYDYARAQGASSPVWWLDVERPASSSEPLWSTDTAANATVVRAALGALLSLGIEPGIYSNSYQWPLIAGAYTPDVAMWQARPNTASPDVYCYTATFTSGPVWLVQYLNSPFDKDLAC